MGYYLPAPEGQSSPGVAPGGLENQFLRKASDANYDTEWVDGGSLSAEDKAKLDGIQPGATANQPDAYLLNRANHTGQQLSITISDSTAAGRALLTAVDTTAQRSALGLGSLATQSGTFSGTSSGSNTGDQTIALTGDVTGSGTGTFATTLSATGVVAGTYGSGNQSASFAVDSKGRLTAVSNVAISIAASAISDSTAAGRALLTAVDTTAQRTALSLKTGATTNITTSTSDPTGGSDGDIWIKYTP